MRVELLGPLRVLDDSGAETAVPAGRQRTLLTRLAVDPGRLVPAAALIDALWPDAPPANASGALQTQVSRLRRLIGDRLRSDSGGYRLTDATTDIADFERLASESATPGAAAGTVRQRCEEALALWRGPALADAAESAFADTETTRLTARRESVASRLVEARLELEGAEAVLAELAARNAADPLSETDAGRYMRALAAAGRQAEALAVYEKTRSRLADELGVDPSPALATAHLDILRGVEAAPAPQRTSALPEPLTACIGRERDLDAIGGLMDSGRLVTLTGPGGTGKTRLAIEAAHRAEDRGETVRLVELAPLSDPLQLPDLVFESLRIGESILARRPDDARDRLVEALRGRELLLVVDNCEHLIGPVADLTAHLLARVPGLRVLGTSREALGITGEAVYPLGPLALPADGTAAPEAYSAVRLFAERARQSDPSFALTGANAALVARTCAALDGLPLAIELAAARLRSMTLDDLAARLDDRFALLTRGDRTAAPRQRTLRGVVDWSWDLLEPAERRVLARMSVFNGGADLAAVTKVCSTSVDTVAGLVDKSLVQRLPSGRYRLLETVREYAAERLAEVGETAAMYLAHCEHYADRAAEAGPHFAAAEQVEWLDRLGADHGNVTAAVRRMIAAGNAAAAHRIMGPLAWYWWMRGYRKEGQELAFQVRAMEGEADPLDRALVCMSGTWGLWAGQLDPSDIASGWEEAGRLAEEHDLFDRFPTLKLVPALLGILADDEEAVRRTFDGLDGEEDLQSRGIVLLFCSGYSERAGDLDRAEAELTECNAVFEVLGERFGLLMSLQALAGISEAKGDYAEARRLLTRALRIESEFGADLADSVITESLWRLDATYGDDPEAVLARLRTEQARAARSWSSENVMAARVSAAVCLRRLGRPEDARDELLAAEADRPEYVKFSDVAQRLYRQLAEVASELGDRDLERRAAEMRIDEGWPFSS
ncbi:BTAD domain-containing putative transcriptional regulator [Glycomyces arizonensis]|uniref:BTAD domain-containing putative transcriptional regulator n=1 Tax=Glycomyces arizonensis TaxID=256035 RepID=UPI000415092B|nr:BTAD domain-containing putative transcriptional regulator [Glycomyces arizonensis]